MRALFQNPELQAEFEKNGFVKIPMLDAQEVERLKSYYEDQQFDNKIEGGFHISLDNMNQDLVNEVGDQIRSVLEPKSIEIFDDAKVFTASYVIKEPGLQNIVPPHQDWTFVDESAYCSLTVWTPLVDVNEDNGALGVIPGSHRLFDHVRSSPSPQSKSPLADHIFTLFPYVQVIEMKAGESLVFNNKLVHASPPNLSDQPRIAVGIGVTQKEAPLCHYYHVPNSEPAELRAFEVTPEFYTHYNNARLSDYFDRGEIPSDLAQIGTVRRAVPDFSIEEMKAHVESLPNVQINQPLMDKLAKLFNYQTGEQEEKEETQPEVVDTRNFFQKYSPGNIVREIAWRAGGRK